MLATDVTDISGLTTSTSPDLAATAANPALAVAWYHANVEIAQTKKDVENH